MNDYLLDEARSRFGTRSLYPYQRLVAGTILNACRGDEEHARRLVAVLPTGGGKSLCFQLPASILEKPTLIVYPLLSLIADQQRRMREAGLRIAVFRGGQTKRERSDIVQTCRTGDLDAVLASPEVLDSSFGREAVEACGFGLAVIDEAHCVTEWGSSFRESYLKLGSLLRNLPVVVAFTATASARTLSGLGETLFEHEPVHHIIAHPDRPELRYTVIPVVSVLHSLTEGFQNAYVCPEPDPFLVHKAGDAFQLPAIVFCRTRGETERVARHLSAHTRIRNVRAYHAGLPSDERTRIEEWFFRADDAVLCATCAYGMGVDKSNIRTVVHTQAPSTIEAYVQEAGRAGRDKQAASAILLVAPGRNGSGPHATDTRMEKFMYDDRCRRESILEAFGAHSEGCAGCDHCAGTREYEAAESTLIQKLIRTYGPTAAARVARGDRLRHASWAFLPGFGCLQDWPPREIQDAIENFW